MSPLPVGQSGQITFYISILWLVWLIVIVVQYNLTREFIFFFLQESFNKLLAKNLNSGRPSTDPASGQTGIESGTAGFRVQALTTRQEVEDSGLNKNLYVSLRYLAK